MDVVVNSIDDVSAELIAEPSTRFHLHVDLEHVAPHLVPEWDVQNAQDLKDEFYKVPVKDWWLRKRTTVAGHAWRLVEAKHEDDSSCVELTPHVGEENIRKRFAKEGCAARQVGISRSSVRVLVSS